MKKKILLIILIGLIVGPSFAEVKRYGLPLEGSPSMGMNSASVTIVEFIDYQ